MAISAEQIQALSDAITIWRRQESINIAFYCLYVYYVLTTVAEEIAIILPQRWNRGKMLYMICRYGLLIVIALELSRDYRNYYSISPNACKVLFLITRVVYNIFIVVCDLSLALCLGALLQAKSLYLLGIVILSCGIPLVNAIFNLVSSFQYPAEPISRIDEELGYVCYVAGDWMEKTILHIGRDVRAYVNLAATTLLALLGIVTLSVRYKGAGGRLVQVISRDGGLHYLSLLILRMVAAIMWTPAVLPVLDIQSSPIYAVAAVSNYVIVAILAQRLLINMRKVDYMGSEPVASKLLFAPPEPGSEDDVEEDFDSHEMAQENSGLRHRGAEGEKYDAHEAGQEGKIV